MINKIKIKNKFDNFKQGFRLYPTSIIISIVLGITLMYSSTISFTESSELLLESIRKIQQLLGIMILIFLTSANINRVTQNKYKTISNIVGLAVSGLIYFLVINKTGTRYEISFIGLIFMFLISSISIVKYKDNFSYHIIKVIEDLIISLVYIGVIIVGVFIIIFTTEFLFEFNFIYYIKQWVLFFALFIFGIPFFISNLPDNLKEYEEYDVNKLIKGLVEYVILTMIIIYTIILYVYLGKILITRNWPNGLVSHLVLWYLVFSLIILVLINDSKEKISNNFKKYFSKVSIPLIIMSFIAIGIRINQYSFTENRYFILAVAIFTFICMIVYSFKKNLDLRIFSFLLVLTIFISLFSPINAFNISKKSQNNRLEKILIKNNMLEDKKLIKNENVSKEDAFEISNIIYYFDNEHSLKDIKVVENINLDTFDKDFGFKYTPDRWYLEDLDITEYFNLSVLRDSSYLDISKYDYFFKVSSDRERITEVNNIKVNLTDNNVLQISNFNEEIFNKSLEKIVFDILKKNEGKNIYDIKFNDGIYIYEDENINLLLIPEGISGEKIKSENTFENVKLNYFEFVILISVK